MSRVDITLGLLAMMGTVVVTAFVGMGENTRMAETKRGWEVRRVENGASLYDLYCSDCHGPNASGGICPPLDETSGLHGDKDQAWRLAELGWTGDTYGYVYSSIASGRAVSTRPEQYPGNKAEDANAMAMPSWAQEYDGPLRPDQVADISYYIAAFADAVAEEEE